MSRVTEEQFVDILKHGHRAAYWRDRFQDYIEKEKLVSDIDTGFRLDVTDRYYWLYNLGQRDQDLDRGFYLFIFPDYFEVGEEDVDDERNRYPASEFAVQQAWWDYYYRVTGQ